MDSVIETSSSKHPTFRQYIAVAIFLAFITAIEVIVIYIDTLDAVMVPLLIALSTVKFAVVVMFYMHLKFEARLFTVLFVAGLALAFGVSISLLALFGSLHADPEPRDFAQEKAVPYVHVNESTESGDGTGYGDQSDFVETNIRTIGDDLSFDLAQINVALGETVKVRFDNDSTLFQHNWVLVPLGSKDAVAAAGMLAGASKGWIPQQDKRVIAHTGLLDPMESEEVNFMAPPLGVYEFVCTFPGHNFTMFGTFEVIQ
jgi:cytochrome c oxidase subunit 4